MKMKIKVGFSGLNGMLKFANMGKLREKVISKAKPKPIKHIFTINNKAQAHHPNKLNLVIDKIYIHKNTDAKTFVLRSNDNSPLPYFNPGQYLSLKLNIDNHFITRPYTIASSPKMAMDGKYSIIVKKVNNGYISDYILDNFKEGDNIETSGPEGTFYYDRIRDKNNIVACAGGSGITPFLSIAKSIQDNILDIKLLILYGNKTYDNILCRDELIEISNNNSNIDVIFILSDEQKDNYESGYISADIIKKYAPEDYSLFLCGPQALYDYMSNEIHKLNINNRLIRHELYGVTKNIFNHPNYNYEKIVKEFNLTIYQGSNSYNLKMKNDEPILNSIEKSGIKSPSKCRSGECGWCKSKIISGEYFVPSENDYRRYTDKEFDYIHPCSAFPLSDIIIELPNEY